jgi:hypothetical protein
MSKVPIEETEAYQLGFTKGYEAANVDHCEMWALDQIDAFEHENVVLRENNKRMADRLVELGEPIAVNVAGPLRRDEARRTR